MTDDATNKRRDDGMDDVTRAIKEELDRLAGCLHGYAFTVGQPGKSVDERLQALDKAASYARHECNRLVAVFAGAMEAAALERVRAS